MSIGTGNRPASVRSLMAWALIALLPAMLVRAWFEGAGFLIALTSSIAVAVLVEAAARHLRALPVRVHLRELSAVLTAVLLVMAAPDAIGATSLAAATLLAVAVGKHAFGGLGENLFNPAMLGLAVLLLIAPDAAGSTTEALGHARVLCGAYLLGGLLLMWRKVIGWHAPLGLLAGAAAAGVASGALGTELSYADFATVLLVAFFIATDPVTGCLSRRGRLCFGFGVGVVAVSLQSKAPNGNAWPFAILLLNFAVPWLDHHSRPARSRIPRPQGLAP